MDDMRKAAYIRARERLEIGESDYVCVALQEAMEEITGSEFCTSMLCGVFPEFFNLFDGSRWTPAGNRYEKDSPSCVWWDTCWKEPRLRIIDTIMSQE